MEAVRKSRSESMISTDSRPEGTKPLSSGSGAKAHWEENTSQCGLCQVKLGKRHLQPRHHCRICGLCVCASCSPSSVELPGLQGLHRACKQCIGNAQKVPKLMHDVAKLSDQLKAAFDLGSSFSGASTASGAASTAESSEQSRLGSFEEAIALCEQAIEPIREEHRKAIAAKELQAQQLEAARLAFLRLGQKIHSLGGSRSNYTWTSELQFVSLEEAAALCDKALVRLESLHRGNKDSTDQRAPVSPAGSAEQAGLASTTVPTPVTVLPQAQPSAVDQSHADRSQALLGRSVDEVDSTIGSDLGQRIAPAPRTRTRRCCCRLAVGFLLTTLLLAAVVLLLWKDIAPAINAQLGTHFLKEHNGRDAPTSMIRTSEIHRETKTVLPFLHRLQAESLTAV